MQKTLSFLGSRELLTIKVNAVNAVPGVGTRTSVSAFQLRSEMELFCCITND